MVVRAHTGACPKFAFPWEIKQWSEFCWQLVLNEILYLIHIISTTKGTVRRPCWLVGSIPPPSMYLLVPPSLDRPSLCSPCFRFWPSLGLFPNGRWARQRNGLIHDSRSHNIQSSEHRASPNLPGNERAKERRKRQKSRKVDQIHSCNSAG